MTACICLDYKAIERFFRSCALSISMQQSIEIEWVEYKDSAVLNVAYSIFFWKEGPGHVEVNIATAAELENKIERLTNRYVQTFITKIHEAGFFAANEFAQQMYGLKQAARESINNAFTSAREINNEIINVTTTAIKKAAAIKLAAGVGVALISGTAGVLAVSGATSIGGMALGGSQLTFTAVGLANSSTHSIIKTWEEGSRANAVAIDFGKTALQEGTGKVTEIIGARTNANAVAANTARANAEVSAKRYAELLARKSTNAQNVAKRADQFLSSQSKLSSAQATAASANNVAGAVKMVGYSLPVIFAGIDILSEVKEYKETMNSL